MFFTWTVCASHPILSIVLNRVAWQMYSARMYPKWRHCIWYGSHMYDYLHFVVRKAVQKWICNSAHMFKENGDMIHRDVWWIIFSRYFQVLVRIKLCINLHLQFILRAEVNICFLVIFKPACCRYFSFALVSAIQLHHQHLSKFLLGFLLGFLYPIQICHRLYFLSLQATLSAFSMSSVSVSGISFCWCSLRITKPLPCYSNTFCTQLISLWSKYILEGN